MSEKTRTYIQEVIENVENTHPEKEEFLQTIKEVLPSLEAYLDENSEVMEKNLLSFLVEPERIIKFRVPWQDDEGKWQVNRAMRVQFNSAIGPYKGGIRFDPSVTESIIRFLGFEQVFKNSLTGLPIGGGKGGSDFNPKGKSEAEIMRFCQSFMTELHKHIGPDTDVPAGDIGVRGREVGYLYGQYKRLNSFQPGVLTGKPIEFWGSLGRTEATGYGTVYFVQNVLSDRDDSFEGKDVVVSGSGNVAIHAMKKATELGACVIACSDSRGYIFDPSGIDIDLVDEIKQNHTNSLAAYVDTHADAEFFEGENVWSIDKKYDIALPCATQNEIDQDLAGQIVDAGAKIVAEGANMPANDEAIKVFKDNQIIHCPGKAANAGGVAVSALEMSQNSQRLAWSFEEVDEQLKEIMKDIYTKCTETAEKYSTKDDLALGANIAGIDRVLKSMLAQGLV